MAEENAPIHEQVAQLADRIDCQLLFRAHKKQPTITRGPQRSLVPVGPYAIGLWQPGDEIHLVCLADNTSDTFWEFIAEKLDRKDLPKTDCIVSEPYSEHTIWLHYCRKPRSFRLTSLEEDAIPTYPAWMIIPPTERINRARLQEALQVNHFFKHTNVGIDTLHNDYHTLRSWAEAAGIFSIHFGTLYGTLDAESLLWMLFDVYANQDCDDINDRDLFSDGVEMFLEKYSDPDSVLNIRTTSGRQAYAPPAHNAVACSIIIAYEISKLNQQPSLLELTPEQYYHEFCEGRTLVLVQAECWVPKETEAFHTELISELSYMRWNFQNLGILHQLRIWPHAFRPSDSEWAYLVGVEHSQPLDAFSAALNAHPLMPDSRAGTVRSSVCSAEEAKALSKTYGISTPSFRPNRSPAATSQPLSSGYSTGHKFPAARQVLDRLRWDEACAYDQYEVGYLDRFEGLMWLPLEQWGRETEEEDFIPQHRIRIFRRIEKTGAKTVVWDRERRVFCL